MKKLFTIIILFACISVSAQAYQTYSMHFVRVEGDLEAFETVQKNYMQKIAQNAVDKGDISFWAFLKSVRMDNIDDEKRKTQAYIDAFKGNSNEMNFYDGSNFEKIDEVGNVYNRLVLFNAKHIHAATQYFGDAIDNSRFFHMFFFDV